MFPSQLNRFKNAYIHRKNSVPTPNSLGGIVGAIVVAETTVLAAAALSSSKEKHDEEQRADAHGSEGTPAAAADSPSLDLQGASP